MRVPSATFCVWANSGNGGHPHNEIMMMNQAPPQAQALNTLDYSILKRYNSKKKSTFVAYGIEVRVSAHVFGMMLFSPVFALSLSLS